MPTLTLTLADLTPFAPDLSSTKATPMIEDALAMAGLVAPCVLDADLDEAKQQAAKAVIRGAILRWHESGSGAVSQQAAGPYSQAIDTRQPRRAMFWPSEIEMLQKICSETSAGGSAWSYDTFGSCVIQHADVCAINFGADYCSCGAILTGCGPLWETGGE